MLRSRCDQHAKASNGVASSPVHSPSHSYDHFSELPEATMGLTISNLFNSLGSLVRWSKDQDVRILMLGLDSAGKACIRHSGMHVMN
jgi:hypothetical protein